MSYMHDPEAWGAALAEALIPPLRSRSSFSEGFRGQLLTGKLGAVRLARFDTPAGNCFRDDGLVRDGDENLCQVDVLVAGRVRLEQEGRSAELVGGDVVVVDPARPVRVASTPTRHFTVLVPRRLLGGAADHLERIAGTRIAGSAGSAALVSSVVRSALTSIDTFGEQEAVRSGTVIADLIATVLSERARPQDAGAIPDETLRFRIGSYISARLADPYLCPASVAAAHHISISHLYKLFRGEPVTVAALIRSSRLEGARADLADPNRQALSAAAIATRWGFTDPAHFSRLFRTAYGCAPGQYRRTVASGHGYPSKGG